MDWIEQAKNLFNAEKPKHFTNFNHCEECAEHDQTLINSDVEIIGLSELGHPSWNPLCFCSTDGMKYYMPALIRLSLETIEIDFYFAQLLFHLESDGKNNSLFVACNPEQRRFIAGFVEYMINHHAEKIESTCCADEAIKVYEIWSNS
jgi:hypothetical protein